ncbi:MAG: hypothetical protein ACLFVW_06055 [Phycisphaerae bacterium]
MSAEPYKTSISEYAEAFDSVRLAKNIFWLLIAAAIVVQLVCFVLVHFVGVTNQAAQLGATQPASSASGWYHALHWIMPAVKFIALVSALLLMLTLMFAVKLSLLERMGGVAGLMSAFFWSLILFALLVPWQDVLAGSFASGALYNLGELTDSKARLGDGWGNKVLFYARYAAYPVVTVLVWLVVQMKFGRGYRVIVSTLAAGAQKAAAAAEQSQQPQSEA